MLVLTRKAGEKIVIGNDITIVVVELTHQKVRLGFDAPKNIPILRDELCRPTLVATPGDLPNRRELQHAAGNP
ncbi:MAG TPA: carbon storage regulator [Gemmataceae bacterium]|nr:carbon storage regulator [Gemmataceae bacterium]